MLAPVIRYTQKHTTKYKYIHKNRYLFWDPSNTKPSETAQIIKYRNATHNLLIRKSLKLSRAHCSHFGWKWKLEIEWRETGLMKRLNTLTAQKQILLMIHLWLFLMIFYIVICEIGIDCPHVVAFITFAHPSLIRLRSIYGKNRIRTLSPLLFIIFAFLSIKCKSCYFIWHSIYIWSAWHLANTQYHVFIEFLEVFFLHLYCLIVHPSLCRFGWFFFVHPSLRKKNHPCLFMDFCMMKNDVFKLITDTNKSTQNICYQFFFK